MKKLLTTLFITLIPLNVYAVSESEQQSIISDQNRLIQRDQQFEIDKIEKKDLKQVEQNRKEFDEEDAQELEEEEGKIVQNLRRLRCFRIDKIIFSPNKILSKKDEKNLVQDYVGKCISLWQITKINKKISDHLIAAGYVTSRSEVPQQSLSDGILRFEIIESNLEEIIFNQEKFSDKAQKFTAFGLIKRNEVLNLRSIEQGLEQVNRLRSNSATIKILPSKNEKSSLVAVENNPKNRTFLSASYDNSGNKLTGSRRETIGLSHDNLFWLNDNLTINRTANDLDKNRKDGGGTNSTSASFSVPLSWYNLTVNYSKSSYFFWGGTSSRFKSSGVTSTKSVSLDRILFKDKKIKLASNFNLTTRYRQNFIDDTKIQVSSRKASIASASLPATFFFENSSLFLKPTYSKGLNILDSKKDDPNIAKNSAHAEFDILKFYGNLSQKLQISEVPIAYNLSFDSQFSKQKLYSNDQFSVGGIHSVRGFKEGVISGDSGYNIKNEFNANLGKIFAPLLSEKNSQCLTKLNLFSVTPFYDYGHVQLKAGQGSGRLSGAGFKLGFDGKNFDASIIFSWAVSKSQFLGAQNLRENSAVFFNLSSEVGFF